MRFRGKTIGFAITGSHCTIWDVVPVIKKMVDEGADIIPIISESVRTTDTRFGKAADLLDKLVDITKRQPIATIVDAEPIGPRKLLDCLVIAPCTGNTLGKLTNGITDGPVTMAAKAQLRNGRPVVIAISTNDALGLCMRNLGTLSACRHVFMVPYGQDNPSAKNTSMVADFAAIPETVEHALVGEQVQPIVVERWRSGHSSH